jgi:octaprenyl-diphosphate synthase
VTSFQTQHQEYLNELTRAINNALQESLKFEEDLFGEISFYNFSGGGKRLRPLIFLLSSQVLGVELSPDTIQVSLIFEFIHMASLLHDDIVDSSDTRRGRPAAHKKYGIPETVLAGDFLLSRASSIAVEKNNMEFIKMMTFAIQELSEGELTQLRARFNAELLEEVYFEIIRQKTASLMVTSAISAALIYQATPFEREALQEFGANFGLSFQIIDDILDYEGSPLLLGKPVLRDLDEGRVTLPFILARESLGTPDRERLIQLGGQHTRTPSEKEEILALVNLVNGVGQARDKARVYCLKAKSALENLKEGPNRDALLSLVYFNLERES